MPDCKILERLEDIPEPVPDANYVVIDVILSSTTIIHLLENGVEYVKPFNSQEEAIEFEETTEDAVLVGEQGGDPIDGFLSPLPTVLEQRGLSGKRVGILTTNGTRAMGRIGKDEDVYVGSTVNAHAVASELHDVANGNDIYLVAAGRYGESTEEDTVGAKLIHDHYMGNGIDDETKETYSKELRSSDTANWITELGFEEEIQRLLKFDSVDTVPRMKDGVFVKD